MHWHDEALILSVRQHGEHTGVVRMLAREHGLFAGIAQGVHSKTNRGVYQPGNRVNATWQARLCEQLGTFKSELTEPLAAFIMGSALKLASLASACTLIEASLPERVPEPKVYAALEVFLKALKTSDDYAVSYVRLELEILASCGFGLDLSACAATGATTDLAYVSPRSGRAVSREAGEPYRDKLLTLPWFLVQSPPMNARAAADAASGQRRKEILAGLRLTGYFLGAWLLPAHHRKMPAARERFCAQVQDSMKELS